MRQSRKEGESMEVSLFKRRFIVIFFREQCPELDSEIGPGWFVNSERSKNWGKHKRSTLLYDWPTKKDWRSL